MAPFSFLGQGLTREDLLRIRALPPTARSSEIWLALTRNYGEREPFHKRSQAEAAFAMLSVMVEKSAVDIDGREIKSIISMAKKCW